VQPAADYHGVVAGLQGGRFPQPVEMEKHGLTLHVSVFIEAKKRWLGQ
jgi:hypothetical protein